TSARAVAPALAALEPALDQAINDLLSKADPNGRRVPIVIDPLIDGNTGVQSAATRALGAQIAAIAAHSYPSIEILPMTQENLAKAKLVLIGTFNLINNAGQPNGSRDAYWVCLALVDREIRTVAARSAARAAPTGADVTPAGFFSESPVWAL